MPVAVFSAAKWGVRVEDATIHHHVEPVGERAPALDRHGDGPAAAWVEPLLHQLRHGEAGRVVGRLEALLEPERALGQAAAQVVERERNYFTHHRDHLNYPEVKEQGCPIGSGAVEATCSQLQDRFKRAGPFWSPAGQGHWLALELARRNDDGDERWIRELNSSRSPSSRMRRR